MFNYLKTNWIKASANACVMAGGCFAIQCGPELIEMLTDISLVKHSAMGLWCVCVSAGMLPGPFPENLTEWVTSLISAK